MSWSPAEPGYDGPFQTIPAPRRLWTSPLEIAQHFIGSFPESAEGRPALDIEMKSGEDGGAMLLITATGYLDDSVSGEQWRIAINRAGEGWGVRSAETRRMCVRGIYGGNWTIDSCP